MKYGFRQLYLNKYLYMYIAKCVLKCVNNHKIARIQILTCPHTCITNVLFNFHSKPKLLMQYGYCKNKDNVYWCFPLWIRTLR